MQLNIQFDEQESKFFVIVDDKESAIHFEKVSPNVFDLIHTYVPPSLRHQGVAAALVKYALTYAKEHHLKIIPTCGYVAHYLRANPEWNDIVALT